MRILVIRGLDAKVPRCRDLLLGPLPSFIDDDGHLFETSTSLLTLVMIDPIVRHATRSS